jgi:hypothetical protein
MHACMRVRRTEAVTEIPLRGDSFHLRFLSPCGRCACHSVVGVGAALHICQVLADKTQGLYHVGGNALELEQLMLFHATPPPLTVQMLREQPAELIEMGFPKVTAPAAAAARAVAVVGGAWEGSGGRCRSCRFFVWFFTGPQPPRHIHGSYHGFAVPGQLHAQRLIGRPAAGPQYQEMAVPTLSATTLEFSSEGYFCPRCQAHLEELPATCPVCVRAHTTCMAPISAPCDACVAYPRLPASPPPPPMRRVMGTRRAP